METVDVRDSASQTTIWLTRPQGQVDGLTQVLSTKGFRLLHLPMLEIESLKAKGAWPEHVKEKVLNLDQYSLVFFISTNAAKLGLSCIDQYWPQYPQGISNFAVGSTTASVLQEYGLQVYFPEKDMTSEGLLALTQLEHVEKTKALIFRGLGGREILAQQLKAKGVEVDYVELYRRNRPCYGKDILNLHVRDNSPGGVVVTSAEALANFETTFEGCWKQRKQVSLFVSSARIVELARTLGYESVFCMSGANDEAIITSLAGAL